MSTSRIPQNSSCEMGRFAFHGVACAGREVDPHFLDMGVRHFSVGTDITFMHQWWKTQGEDMRKALGGS